MDNLENNAPNPTQAEPTTTNPVGSEKPVEKKTSWGPFIGLIIILALIIVGSLYFLSQDKVSAPTTESNSDIEDDLQGLRAQGSSDELADIEADLEATNFDNIDAELNLAEEEL